MNEFSPRTPRATTSVRTVEFANAEEMISVLGPQDAVIQLIETSFHGVALRAKGLVLSISGHQDVIDTVASLIAELKQLHRRGVEINSRTVERLIKMLISERSDASVAIAQNIVSSRGKAVRPKTINQKNYVDAIDDNTVIFGIGPAGTGKTYLAMAKAVQALQSKEVSRIILTRPAVEAGERLGFLPGSLNDKIDPYLRPLYDALHDMIDGESIPKLMEAGTIEVAPLAYMRGRTLNDAFIILDEAQNTSAEQMKMFLTRLGFGSKMVITGDTTQVDLPNGQVSGLRQIRNVLTGIEDIHFADLTSNDVVRHSLVSDIVSAYDKWDEDKKATQARKNRQSKRRTIEAAAEKLLESSGLAQRPDTDETKEK